MTTTIRQAKVEDAPCIAEAEREIAQEPGYFCSQPSELSDQRVKDTISKFLKHKAGIYLVAECEGQVVGHAFLEPLHLKSIYHVAQLTIGVHKGWQEKGIGTKLLEQLIEWARQSETIEKIELNVRASNTTAIALYKKMGFQEEGRLKNRVKVGDQYIDDIVMALDVRHDQSQEENGLLLRALSEEDIEPLIQTFCFPWSSVQSTTEKWNRYFAEQKRGIRSVYLVEKQGQLVGYGSLLHHSKYLPLSQLMEINDVWIDKDHRGTGLGKKLIVHLENLARETGHKQLCIGVGLYDDYGPAQRLYFHLGYVPDGRGITYKFQAVIPGEKYPVDDDLILWMVKSI
jgi:ribosomal protein S18 acetylase RimI-like enzyme